MKSRLEKSLRYVDEYLKGTRNNPRLCLTEEESEIIKEALPSGLTLRKGNSVSTHLSMYKIKRIY